MTKQGLWRISVVTSPAGEEAIAELLASRFHQPSSSYTHARTGRTRVSVYLSQRPPWTAQERARLKSELKRLTGGGAIPVAGEASLDKVRWEDWAESWKRHFRPLEIDSKLLVQPSWSRRRARQGQALVRLDPGLSFGTGQHPTTRFCLQELVRRRWPNRKQTFLDLGTGSGILAISAVKLGYGPIVAIDLDPDALRVARANARQNAVARKIRFLQRDLTSAPVRSPKRYSVVCANLTADLLLKEFRRICSCLEPGGVLVLAGILNREFTNVQKIYESSGLQLLRSGAQAEWRSGSFRAESD